MDVSRSISSPQADDEIVGSELVESVKKRVHDVLGKEPVLHHYTDPSMIGGIKLRIGDQLVDGSVATRLRRMKEEILGEGVRSICAPIPGDSWMTTRIKATKKRRIEDRYVKIKTDEITSVIKQEIEQFASELEISEVGQVVEVGDGIARVYGLSKVMAGELLEFQGEEGSVMGQAMNLEQDTVGAVLYGESTGIREGDTVRATGGLLEVPVGEGMLGRVVDPLGNPIDGGPRDRRTTEKRKLDIVAPGIAYRQPVKNRSSSASRRSTR